MTQADEIRFMKARIIRLAAEEWGLTIEKVVDLFDEHAVLQYIAEFYGIFHCEGDQAVLADIREYLESRGVAVNA